MKNLISQSFQTNTNSAGLFLLFYRFLIGTFFAVIGYNQLFTAADQDNMWNLFMLADIPFPEYTTVLVAAVELGAGVLLVLGLLSRLSALALWTITLVALIKVAIYDIPVDVNTWGAWFIQFLWLPETLYLIFLLMIIVQGCGTLGMDNMIGKRAKARRYY